MNRTIEEAADDAVSEYVVTTYAFKCPYCEMFDNEDTERRETAVEWARDHFGECEKSPFYKDPVDE